MSDEEKAKWAKVHDDCFGQFHPFRDHDTEFGWGICHAKSGRTFGYIGDKSACHGVSAALNGNFESAKEFLNGIGDTMDAFWKRENDAG